MHRSINSTLAGVFFNGLLRLVERNKCHGRLPLLDATMPRHVASSESMY